MIPRVLKLCMILVYLLACILGAGVSSSSSASTMAIVEETSFWSLSFFGMVVITLALGLAAGYYFMSLRMPEGSNMTAVEGDIVPEIPLSIEQLPFGEEAWRHVPI